MVTIINTQQTQKGYWSEEFTNGKLVSGYYTSDKIKHLIALDRIKGKSNIKPLDNTHLCPYCKGTIETVKDTTHELCNVLCEKKQTK